MQRSVLKCGVCGVTDSRIGAATTSYIHVTKKDNKTTTICEYCLQASKKQTKEKLNVRSE